MTKLKAACFIFLTALSIIITFNTYRNNYIVTTLSVWTYLSFKFLLPVSKWTAAIFDAFLLFAIAGLLAFYIVDIIPVA